MRARLAGYDHSMALFCCLTVKDVFVTRWRWTNYVMGIQPVRQAINLGEAEMTSRPCLYTVTGTGTLGFHASLNQTSRVLCSGFLNMKTTVQHFPVELGHKNFTGFRCMKTLRIGLWAGLDLLTAQCHNANSRWGWWGWRVVGFSLRKF